LSLENREHKHTKEQPSSLGKDETRHTKEAALRRGTTREITLTNLSLAFKIATTSNKQRNDNPIQ